MTDGPAIFMRIHAAGDQVILAACDKELLGRTLVRGDLQFKISYHFYGGDLVNEKTFLMMMGQVTSANVVGNHCVGLLIESGMVEKESVIRIENVMHVQVYHVSMER
jgi:hypothetical protein